MTPSRRPAGDATILVVEDQEDLREIFCEILEELGYAVLSAASGSAALEVVRSHAGTIHLILTDLRMPGMNGQELVARAFSLRPHVRVLYVSGDRATLAAHGSLGSEVPVLEKPFTSVVLATAIQRALGSEPSLPA